MITGQLTNDGYYTFTLAQMLKGLWANKSVLSLPQGFVTGLTNFDLTGGMFTSMLGNADFISTAWPNDTGTLNLLTHHKSATGVVTYIIATTAGIVYKWTGAAWSILRQGLSTTSTLWWAAERYGTDLYIANPTDGVFRYDGDTLARIGAKPIAQMESDEASLWSGETADTTNFVEGTQSMYVESSGAQTTMTFTPSTNFNAVAGRFAARDYESDKSPGTDFYHFKVRFSDTGTNDTTNTRVLLTDGDTDTLNFPFSTWDSDRSGTAFSISLNTWQDVYLPASAGTEGGTFNAANIDTFAFAVDTSAGTLRMNVDDFSVLYATTMPAVQYLAEWRNLLFGATPTVIYFSPENGADEFNTLAETSIKSNGDLITGMKRFFNQLTITTESQVHSFAGQVSDYQYPAYIFDQNQVTDEIGCSSHRSIVKAGERLFWWFNTNIVEYNGTAARKVSYAIDTLLETVDPAALQYIVGARFNRKNQAWWTWQRSGQSVRDRILRYDYVHNAFLHTEGLATPLLNQAIDTGVEYLLTADSTNRKVKKEGQTGVYTLHGTNIEYTLEFPPMLVPGEVVEWDRLHILYLSNTGAFNVQFREADHLRALSAASYATLEAITMSTEGEYGIALIGRRSQLGQLRLTLTAALLDLEMPLIVKAFPVNDPQQRVTP